jgi:phosphotransferase system  glucose/maltose/N-acetylglucosamine-specific IIC component
LIGVIAIFWIEKLLSLAIGSVVAGLILFSIKSLSGLLYGQSIYQSLSQNFHIWLFGSIAMFVFVVPFFVFSFVRKLSNAGIRISEMARLPRRERMEMEKRIFRPTR